jgi:hypothetical protein
MGFQQVAIFGVIDVEMESTGTGTLTLSTDLPGTALAVRETKAILATSRRPVRFRLLGTTKGHIYSVRIVPANGCVMRLYKARIWARVLPGPEWQWYAIPLPATPEEWSEVKLEIPGVGQWEERKLEIPPMGQWTEAKLPIAPPSEWSVQQLPIRPTPANPSWVNIGVDE